MADIRPLFTLSNQDNQVPAQIVTQTVTQTRTPSLADIFYKDIPLEFRPTHESGIKKWQQHHAYHLRDPSESVPIYFALCLISLCGGEQEDYFYVTEEVYYKWKSVPEYQMRLARYICPYFKCHTWPLLFVQWTYRRFLHFIRHCIGKYGVALYKAVKSDAHYIEKRQICCPNDHVRYLNYFVAPLDSAEFIPFPPVPYCSVGRPVLHKKGIHNPIITL